MRSRLHMRRLAGSSRSLLRVRVVVVAGWLFWLVLLRSCRIGRVDSVGRVGSVGGSLRLIDGHVESSCRV